MRLIGFRSSEKGSDPNSLIWDPQEAHQRPLLKVVCRKVQPFLFRAMHMHIYFTMCDKMGRIGEKGYYLKANELHNVNKERKKIR